jgi:hypothetical protein
MKVEEAKVCCIAVASIPETYYLQNVILYQRTVYKGFQRAKICKADKQTASGFHSNHLNLPEKVWLVFHTYMSVAVCFLTHATC